MSVRVISDKISKFMMVMAATWAFVLTFIIMADIIGRGVFNDPLNGVREIVANSIVIIVFLQAGYAIRSRSMLSADFVVNLFPAWARRAALALGYLLGVAFFVLIIWGGWQLAIDSWVGGEFEGEGALRVPAWPTRFLILVGSALAIVNYLVMAYLDVVRPASAGQSANDQNDDFRPAPKH
jgi:TRAP-type C4-dicarboxylate transport system permease small subunit